MGRGAVTGGRSSNLDYATLLTEEELNKFKGVNQGSQDTN